MQLNWKEAGTWAAIGGIVGGLAAAGFSTVQAETVQHYGATTVTELTAACAFVAAFLAALKKRSS